MKSLFNPYGVSVGESPAKRFLPAAILSGLFGYGMFLIAKNPSLLADYVFFALLFFAVLPLEKKFYKPFGSKFLICISALFWCGGFFNGTNAKFFLAICLVILRVSQEIFDSRPRALSWIWRVPIFYIQFFAEAIYFSVAHLPKIFDGIKANHPGKNIGRNLAAALVIALICVVFIAIFCGASPQFLAAVKYISSLLPEFVYKFDSLVKWLIFSVLFFGLFSITLHLKLLPAAKEKAEEPAREFFTDWHIKIFSIALALFNAIFLLQNFFDLKYMLGGCALPSGTTYSEYALDGAFALALATIVAAAIIALAFRRGVDTNKWRAMRILALVWIAQNIMLAISACVRLGAYSEAYGLTALRIYGFAFFALVLCGFALSAFKISREKSVRWLVDANICATAAIFALLGLFSHDMFVANYNAGRYINSSKKLDIGYMQSLGADAIPAWIAIASSPKSGKFEKETAEKILLEQFNDFKKIKCEGYYFDYKNLKLKKALEKYFKESSPAQTPPQNPNIISEK